MLLYAMLQFYFAKRCIRLDLKTAPLILTWDVNIGAHMAVDIV